MNHDELIEALEKATGPDRELDVAIRDALALWKEGRLADDPLFPALPYTASLDAALTLVPEGAKYEIRGPHWRRHPNSTAACWPVSQWAGNAYEAATPALALCIAALRARSTKP